MAGVPVCLAVALPASAQQPEPRAVAVEGLVEARKPVWETHIAAGLHRLMAVYQVGHRGDSDHEIGYGIATRAQPHGGRSPQPDRWFWTMEEIVPGTNDANDNYPISNALRPLGRV
jgi:hypothetical protein